MDASLPHERKIQLAILAIAGLIALSSFATPVGAPALDRDGVLRVLLEAGRTGQDVPAGAPMPVLDLEAGEPLAPELTSKLGGA